MSALGQKWTNHLTPKSSVIRYCPKADIEYGHVQMELDQFHRIPKRIFGYIAVQRGLATATAIDSESHQKTTI